MNVVVQSGRWTRDPELRYTSNGVAVASGRLAVNRDFRQEGQPEADFFNVIMWRKLAENTANCTVKGHYVVVHGRLQNREYTDSAGTRHFITEIVADKVDFGPKPGNGGGGPNGGEHGGEFNPDDHGGPAPAFDETEVPF